MKNYNYKRTTAKVRQLDGTYKYKGFYGKTGKELTAKVKAAQEKAETEYQLSLNPFFNDVADAWNDMHEKEVAYNTWSSYQAPLKDLKAEFDGLRITEITPMMLQNILNTMKSQGYAKQTISLRKIVASLIFDFAVVSGYVDTNPCLYLKMPKNAPQTKRKAPTSDDIEKMLNAKGQYADIARFLYYTGCRRGEALALTADDIQDGYIKITKTLYWNNNKPIIKNTPKTSSGVRSIPILKPLQAFLENRQGILFRGKNGYITKGEYDKGWAKFQKDNDLHLTAHQLRHGFATLCYDAELSDKDAAELMGHSSVALTKDIYTHITTERAKVQADKLNRLVG